MKANTTTNAAREAGQYDWQPNGHGRHSRQVGTLRLKSRHEFIQYGSNAADTDYVTCEPQTVAVMQHGDDYWLCAGFTGVLTGTTRTYQVKIGQPARAALQTQSFGGVGSWLESDLFEFTLEHPALELAQVGKYSTGKPMFAVCKRDTTTSAAGAMQPCHRAEHAKAEGRAE